MAVDAATFVSEFPEFQAVLTSQPALVDRALRAAQLQVDAVVFASAYQDAVFLMAAHHLAMSPYGENLRLKDPTQSLYLEQFNRLSNSRRPRVMVGGGFGGFGSGGFGPLF